MAKSTSDNKDIKSQKPSPEKQHEGFKFPTEQIDLPSGGKIYGKDSPISNGKIEIKYMTAKEEDILTSQNLIKKGVVIDRLLDSLIVTSGVSSNNLIMGDKNAVMVAARILAYGAEYKVEYKAPGDDTPQKYTFDLSDVDYKKINVDVDYSSNRFEFNLPTSKNKVIFKLLNGFEEHQIDQELKGMTKLGSSKSVTTRLKKQIISVDGNDDRGYINAYVENMLSRDSLAMREYISSISPDIDLSQYIENEEGETVRVDIPMTVNFFWPSSEL